MKLDTWLNANNLSDDDFASKIEVSRQAVWRYKSGRVPKRAILERISKATGGQVMPNDFLLPAGFEVAQ